MKKGIMTFVVVVMVIAGLVFVPFIPRKVNSGEVLVVKNFGEIKDVRDAGLTFTNPFRQKGVKVKTAQDIIQTEYEVSTSDMQTVTTVVAVRFSLDREHVTDIVRDFGGDYKETLVEPSIAEAVNAATARFTIEELVEKRGELAVVMTELITENLAEQGVSIRGLDITDHKFSEEYEASVERVKVMQQKTKADQEEVKQATLKAEANRISAEAYSVENFKYEWLKKWDGKMPQVIGENGQQVIMDMMTGENLE